MSNKRVLIIAEAGVNHNGDINLAKKLIDAAADAGVDYVKFQTFKTEKLVSKSAQKASYQSENLKSDDNSQFSMLKKLELSPENHFELIEYAKQKGVNFLSTAFDLDSLAFLDSLNLNLFKVPSGEITNKPYLQAIAKTKKPVIISTGMANMQEIEDSISVFETEGYLKTDITVLHCNTQYPTPFEDVNLMAMKTIGDAFGVKIGYSDHTNGIEVPTAAVALGATVIEKHFTLDKTMEGPDHKASLDPKELKGMVSAIRNIEIALGNGEKKPSPSESKNLEAARKSIHLAVSLKKGEVLKYEHLIMKRPGNGISPMDFESALGKKVNVDLEEDTQLKPEHLS
jgi:N,N'-diacetyllegionaminate synthase